MTARFFRHGELPLVLLALLERSPMHGYQIVSELDVLFGDRYEPSTGSVYPAIRALEDEGLVESTEDGRRAVYSLTAVGRSSLQRRGEQLAALELRTNTSIRRGAAIDAAVDRLAQRTRQVARAVDEAKAIEVLELAIADLEALAGITEGR